MVPPAQRQSRHSILWVFTQMLSRHNRARLLLPVAAMLVAVTAEIVGVGAIWPVIMLATGTVPQGDGVFARAIQEFFILIGGRPPMEAMLTVLFLALTCKAAIGLAGQQLIARGTASMAAELRLDLMSALLAARWNYLVQQSTGAIANAVSGEATRAAGIFSATVNLLTAALTAIPFALIALSVSWEMTLGAIILSGVIMLLMRTTLAQTRRFTAQLIQAARSLIGRLVDDVVSLKPIRAMDLQNKLWPFLVNDVEQMALAERKQNFSKNFQAAIQEPLIVLIICIGLYAAMKQLNLGIVEIGFMVVLFQRLMIRFVSIQNHLHSMATSEVAYTNYVGRIASARVAVEAPGSEGADQSAHSLRLKSAILLRSVSFSYEARDVFRNLTLELPAGKFILIVGPSGAGKTSLIDLVTGLQWPQSGRVEVDGVPLDEGNIRSWRRRIGYVPQELQLLNGTVFTNVSLMDEAVSRHDVKQALETAGAWNFVEVLPGGMDAMVGERGAMLSGGQRQRIALARAIVRKPDLLILDEATTALDPATERSIGMRLREIVGPMTILAISHQPALAEHADVVLRIHDGKVDFAEPNVVASLRVTRSL